MVEIPWFYVDDGFSDSKPVMSIDPRYRLAACGLWTLAGSWSAKEETDGAVPREVLRSFGHGNTVNSLIRHLSTGPAPLWTDSEDGGIQFRGWAKWQKTRADLMAKRAGDAERQRRHRGRNQPVDNRSEPPVDNGILTANRPQTDRILTANERENDGKTTGKAEPHHDSPAETETCHGVTSRARAQTRPDPTYTRDNSPTEESSLNVGVERGLTDPVNISASRLVAALIPDTIPAAVRTALRIEASQLIVRDKMPGDHVAEALRRWLNRPGAGTGLLAHIAADVAREHAGGASSGKPKHKMRELAELEQRTRAQEQANPTQKELP